MNCKNCQTELTANAKYCHECGAQVITERITLKNLLGEIFKKYFGWDNRFLFTLKEMFVRPGEVLKGFLEGVRQRYTPPLTFFAIGAAISLLVIAQFNDEFRAMNSSMSGIETTADDNQKDVKIRELQQKYNSQLYDSMLGNWNLYSFLLLPFYTLIAFWVFGAPYNFGEHLIINAYIQTPTFIIFLFAFLMSIWISPSLYGFGQVGVMIYYAYAYKQLYQHTFKRTILKFLKFLAILLGVVLGMVIIGVIAGIISTLF